MITKDKTRYRDMEASISLSNELNKLNIIENACVVDEGVAFKYESIDNSYIVNVMIPCPLNNNEKVYFMRREKGKYIIHSEAMTEDAILNMIIETYSDILKEYTI